MSYKLIEITDPDDYKPLEIYPYAQFTQSWFYGQWQEYLNREVKRFALLDGKQRVAYLQVIPHSLPMGKKYLYIPFGPVLIKKPSQAALEALWDGLNQHYPSSEYVFARFDPDGDFKPLNRLKSKQFQPAPKFIHREASFRPRGEMVVELSGSIEDVITHFDKNTRYSIRYAGKKGVATRINTDLASGLDDFYRLLCSTADLQGFAIFSKDYYRNLLEVCQDYQNTYFVEAVIDNHVVSSKLIVVYGTVAHSLLSGTDETGRKLRVPSLVQSVAIEEALRRGCTRYSIGGASSSEDDYPSIKKVTKYKEGFGGHVIVHSDLHDFIFNTHWYRFYKAFKTLKSIVSKS